MADWPSSAWITYNRLVPGTQAFEANRGFIYRYVLAWNIVLHGLRFHVLLILLVFPVATEVL